MHLRTGLLACSKTDCVSEKSRRSITISSISTPLGFIPIGLYAQKRGSQIEAASGAQKLNGGDDRLTLRQTGVWQVAENDVDSKQIHAASHCL